jgi:threonine synthase
MITPQPIAKNLSKELNTKIYLKREDLHPFASHKGRSIPLMIEKYVKDGWRDFVISSSGNAALSAVYAIKEYNKKHADEKIRLNIFVGKKIEKGKMKKILYLLNEVKQQVRDEERIIFSAVNKPKQMAFLLEKNNKAKNLRQSTDNLALIGYYDLAKELGEIKNLSAVFIPTSSGTTAQGLFEGFKKLKLKPQIHIVQTSFCHPLINGTREIIQQTPSLASAIVDKVAHRKQQILKILKNTGGKGWIATNEEIKNAMKLIKKTEKINTSPNSALSIVGLTQAINQEWKFNGPVICLITGK